MRLLIDNSVSWRIARDLRESGHDAVHIADLGLAAADDRVIFQLAVAEARVIVTQDSDFGPIHSIAKPRTGVVLLRLSDGRPRTHASVLLANLPALEAPLTRGAFAIIEDAMIRIHDHDAPT